MGWCQWHSSLQSKAVFPELHNEMPHLLPELCVYSFFPQVSRAFSWAVSTSPSLELQAWVSSPKCPLCFLTWGGLCYVHELVKHAQKPSHDFCLLPPPRISRWNLPNILAISRAFCECYIHRMQFFMWEGSIKIDPWLKYSESKFLFLLQDSTCPHCLLTHH